ncbi:hypothetical protein PIROE2DRAFT_7718 [Piromyces sp. E2]|nr:hypothetical protein PIROE2DRAFT_7718 [Piromyces sp. E2]|eukprot:OUM65261.1 hypothetical protein PIROE2DRAFT_7718 [Piromyces sp. E2]
MVKVSSIFEDRLHSWGLRGDPFFWEHLQKKFEKYELPMEYEELERIIMQEHRRMTGTRLTEENIGYCKKFARGGMSSGGVSGNFWIKKALPILKQRLFNASEIHKKNMNGTVKSVKVTPYHHHSKH